MGVNPPPGLKPSNNLSDLQSQTSGRRNSMPVTLRSPNGGDAVGYIPGVSLWIEPDKTVRKLNDIQSPTPSIPAGFADWLVVNQPGTNPGAFASGATFLGGTRRVVPTWTGNLFQVTRYTDLVTFIVTTNAEGDPDVAGLAAFLVPTNGIGYISIIYDQSGNGNNLVGTTLASMPRVTMLFVVGNNIPIDVDVSRRNYWLGNGVGGINNAGTFPVSWTSGNTVTLQMAQTIGAIGSISGTTMTITTAPTPYGWFVAGQIITGTGATAGTTITVPLLSESGAGTYQITPSQNVASTSLTGNSPAICNDVQPGCYVAATNIPNFVGTVTCSGTTMTIVSTTSGAPVAGMSMFGMTDGTVIQSGSGSTWTINNSQTIASAITVTGYTTITAINWSTGVMTLSCTPTGTPGALAITNPGVYLNLPSGHQVNWRSYSVVMSYQVGVSAGFAPWVLGVQGGDGINNATNYAGQVFESVSSTDQWGSRITMGNNQGTFGLGNGTWATQPQVWAVMAGGTNGTALSIQFGGAQASFTGVTVPNATLSGGAIGGNQQFLGGKNTNADLRIFDILMYSSTLTFADVNNITASINLARGWLPQVVNTFVGDGSSTTAGAGTTGVGSWPTRTAVKLGNVSPMVAINAATGGNENGLVFFPIRNQYIPASSKNLLIVHWGLGNSIQLSGAFTVSSQSGNVLTISGGIVNRVIGGINLNVSGTNIPFGTITTAADSVAGTVTLSQAPTGTITTINVSGCTPTSFWQTMILYLQAARAQGYSKVVMIGSATRGAFGVYPNSFLATFNSIKTYMRENWQALAQYGLVGFMDWEDLPAFGDDGGMAVTGISGQVITVATPSNAAQIGNRIRWTGMLGNASQIAASIAAGTGGQFITAVSGNNITVLNPILGLSVGQSIRGLHAAPWSIYPQMWGNDHQHFTPIGYEYQASALAEYLTINNILT